MIQTTIVAFGDSITFGYGVSKKCTYTRRLEAFLPQCYPSVNWKIENSGVNGDTTREALERIQKDVLNYHPNIVFILLGSNDSALVEDQYRTPYEYEKNMCSIIEQIQNHNNHTGLNHCRPIVVLITPPPVVDTDFFPFTTTDRVKGNKDRQFLNQENPTGSEADRDLGYLKDSLQGVIHKSAIYQHL